MMGYCLTTENMNVVLSEWAKEYEIYAPKRYMGGGAVDDTANVRYGQIGALEEIAFDQKSDYSFK